jgi:BMFP domain-containing protein YqiC
MQWVAGSHCTNRGRPNQRIARRWGDRSNGGRRSDGSAVAHSGQSCVAAVICRTRENAMLNSKTLDDLAARIGKAFEGSPAKDIEKNVKAMLQSGLARLDLVSRQEFDVQAEVLRKTRDKVERLEARVSELEARMPPPGPGA